MRNEIRRREGILPAIGIESNRREAKRIFPPRAQNHLGKERRSEGASPPIPSPDGGLDLMSFPCGGWVFGKAQAAYGLRGATPHPPTTASSKIPA
jgi:hypothetical protein